MDKIQAVIKLRSLQLLLWCWRWW